MSREVADTTAAAASTSPTRRTADDPRGAPESSRSGPARPSLLAERHTIAAISFQLETVECSCGFVATAAVDGFLRDRHEPLAIAFALHRSAAGARARLFRPSVYGKRAAMP